MISSINYDPGLFSYFDSNAKSVANSLWDHCPAQVIIVGIVEKDDFVIEKIYPLQKACLGNEVISVGKPLSCLLPPPLGGELVMRCAQCVEEGLPIQYEVTGGYIDGDSYQRNLQVLLLPIINQSKVIRHLHCIVLNANTINYAQVAKYSEQEVERCVLERTAELMATNLQLTYLATHDGLTETYNRRHLIDLANAEFKRVTRYGLSLCLMMLDIDHFKSVNDEQGHAAGDDMLKTVAHLMRSTVRDWDLVGRYGGDEFIIILPDTDIQSAKAIANRLSNNLKAANLTVSLGIATLEPSDQSIDDAISRADHLLLNAKRNGRNRIECGSFGSNTDSVK
ncbi:MULTISPECIES: GGDEF domain-containing protein [unclassified Halomonas]|uniref:GGDEF domain-containing protein n=1 Tax=unclassified Halomonas TaxID=2609666 RepID=UPI0007F13B5D|nr:MULTISPECIES: GGDEF domain-containing protein [unclassified Halomonas]SBR51586.1 diguanylate cyclase (GGDEF) domain-containing protein [Halomonas sp. HL-93]SNY97421.1 diguanylate cyclase (GGDEF) domain-containing protein [Halomonas sp. hl-4]